MDKQTKAAIENTHGFRVIVRGTIGTGKKAKRIRRVRTIHAVDTGAAMLAVEKDKSALAGLDKVYLSVLPPLVAA